MIRSEDSDRTFRWLAAEWSYRAFLIPGQRYVLLLHSPDTQHKAPWVVNATYWDVYPNGRHLGYADDLFFAVAFEVAEIHVGPPRNAAFDIPLNSGRQGGPATRRPTALSAQQPRPHVADRDPIGPIPYGVKVLAPVRRGDGP